MKLSNLKIQKEIWNNSFQNGENLRRNCKIESSMGWKYFISTG